MSRVLLTLRAALALSLVLGVATVAPADDVKKAADKKKAAVTKKTAADGKKKAGPKTVAIDSLDLDHYPNVAETSKPGERSKDRLEAVIAQFKVETNKRYLPRSGATFCNIYARDVSYAMGVKIPLGMLANDIYDWLPSKAGKAAGWVLVTPEEAQKCANAGRPVVVSFKNLAKMKVKNKDGTVTEKPAHGHIGMVRPSDQPGGPYISNAGSKNGDNVPVSKVFSAARLKTIKYYANK